MFIGEVQKKGRARMGRLESIPDYEVVRNKSTTSVSASQEVGDLVSQSTLQEETERNSAR